MYGYFPKDATSYSSTLISERGHSVERALDETRENITKSIDEARRDIPRNTQAINDYQEHTLQASKEIADTYLESPAAVLYIFSFHMIKAK